MGIKTILVAASGGTATGGAIDVGCRVAQRFRAHLEGYHARLDIPGAAAALGEGAALGPTGMIVKSMLAEGKAAASEARSLFATILARHTIALDEWPGPVECRASATWREETGYAPALVAKRARFFDLAVLGRSERAIGEPHTDTIEQVLAWCVADVMTREVISVNETTDLADVATLLETKGIKRVPVLNDGKLVGIISRANLVRALAATESAALTLSQSEEEEIRNRVLDESIRKRLIEELGQLKWVDHLTNVIVKNQTVHLWFSDDQPIEQRRAVHVAAENTAEIRGVEEHIVPGVPLPPF